MVRRPGEDGNAYGGPYIPASLARRTGALVRRLFGIRSCKETLERQAPAPLPAVPDQALPGAVRGRDLLARALPAGLPTTRGCSWKGRTEEVTRRLREQMATAATDERYEQAASLRDQVQALLRLEAPQKITTTDIEERDVFAAHVEGERAAVQVFFVRDGKVVAREGFLLDRLTEPERVLSDTLQQFYAQGRYVPREIVVPAEIPDRELLEAWLTERRGTNVRIHLPQRGEKVRLVELVARNAQLAFELEWKHPRKQSQEILRSLRDLLDLELEPNRIECFDISNIQGSDVVASMVVFEDGLREEVRLPQVPDQDRLGRPRRLRLDARGRGPPLQAPARGGQGAARPGPDRRRQGPARPRRSRRSRSWASASSRSPRLAKREELIFLRGREEPIVAAAHLAGAAAGPARPRRGPPLRDRLSTARCVRAHDRLGAGRHPGHRAGQAAEAAVGFRVGPRCSRRDRGRTGGCRGEVERGAAAGALRRRVGGLASCRPQVTS